MAIPCMVNTTIAVQNSSSSHLDNFEPTARCGRIVEDSEAAQEMGYQGTLDWSPSMQALLFSSTFYSSLVSVLFVGYLADRFGPKIMLLGASVDFLIMSYLAPSLASHSYWAFFGTRLVMGLAEGAVFPCLNSLAAKWFPPTEKSTMAAIYTSGIQISSAFSAPISAFLCTTSVGWPSIFYFFATAGLVWVILGLIFVTNSPSKNKFVSEREKKYLELHVGNNAKLAKNAKMPWKKLLFSKEVLAVNACSLSSNFISNTMQSFLPTYLMEVLALPIHLNGVYSMVPFCSQLLCKNTMSPLSDYLKRRGHSPTKLGRIFQGISSFGSGTFVILLGIIPSCDNPVLAIPLLMGYDAIPGTLGSMGGPLLLSLINYLQLPYKWPILFTCCAVLHYIGGIIFTPEGLRPYAVLLFNLAFTDGVACFVGYFVMQRMVIFYTLIVYSPSLFQMTSFLFAVDPPEVARSLLAANYPLYDVTGLTRKLLIVNGEGYGTQWRAEPGRKRVATDSVCIRKGTIWISESTAKKSQMKDSAAREPLSAQGEEFPLVRGELPSLSPSVHTAQVMNEEETGM
ncbi:unnamed protein product, partial [Mesorhabditis spiculigera]